MTRIILLGVDGVDADFVRAHLDDLPTLARYERSGVVATLPSIFPPDSIPAWITIFTGLEPAEHGIVESIDYLARRPAEGASRAPSVLEGATFWDRASASGSRVCVVNPFMAYPAWPVEGVMVSGPVFTSTGAASIRSTVGEIGDVPDLGGIVAFPTRHTLAPFLDSAFTDTRELIDFSIRLLRKVEPDLMFVNLLTVDRVQHFLWRYGDRADPTYPGPSSFESAVLGIYKLLDDALAEFERAAGGDALLMVVSDHGHGRRPTRMLYLDEWLRRNGYVSPGGILRRSRTLALDNTKRFVASTAYRLGIEEDLERAARRLPGKKALKTSSYSVAPDSIAGASRKFGRNSSNGVRLNRDLDEPSRASLIDEICNGLLAIADPETGERVVEWAKAREEVVSGQHVEVFPNLLFQLREDLGVDFGLYGPLFGPDVRHRRISGGHKRNGVFAASAPLQRIPTKLSEVGSVVLSNL